MIHLDTSVVIAALAGREPEASRLRSLIADSERVVLSTIVLYEWLRGPRHEAELAAAAALFPHSECAPFGAREAALAAALYRQVKRPRGREVELCIASVAMASDAALWTGNRRDFDDVPGLILCPAVSKSRSGRA